MKTYFEPLFLVVVVLMGVVGGPWTYSKDMLYVYGYIQILILILILIILIILIIRLLFLVQTIFILLSVHDHQALERLLQEPRNPSFVSNEVQVQRKFFFRKPLDKKTSL